MSPMQPPSERDSGTNEVIPVPNVVRAERIAGEDEEDTELLKEMLEEAKNYVLSSSWCESRIWEAAFDRRILSACLS